jgi:RNA polymerase sigma-70 factor (ECF subfamily)
MRSDEELMLAYVGGDFTAFGELFRRYSPHLRALLMRRLKNAALTEDLVQQTFLQMHRARYDFRHGARVRPWLFTIAMNLGRADLRRQLRSPVTPGTEEGRSEPAQFTAQQGKELWASLDQLPADQRDVIVLYWFEGLSFQEIAEQVGASLSAVKVRAHRGYKALRVLLGSDSNFFDERS